MFHFHHFFTIINTGISPFFPSSAHSRTLRQLLPDDFNDNLSVEDIIPSLSRTSSPALQAQKLALTKLQEDQRRQMKLERETEVLLQEVLRDDDAATDTPSTWTPVGEDKAEVVLQGRPMPRPKT